MCVRGYIPLMKVVAFAFLTLIAPCAAWAQAVVPYAVVFDRYMTPAAGAQDLLTVQHQLATEEDRWLPLKIGSESTRRGLALGISYRSAKFLFLDMPQDHFLMVVAHEVFGHGARFRELGEGELSYGFDAPIPYGSGDAFTKFSGAFPVSPLADMTASASGMEAQHSLADAIAERAMSRGRLHYREGWLYFESRMTAVNYILSASPHSSDGHDVASYLETFEKACVAPCSPLTRNEVQRRSLIALADPLLYYSMYGLAVSYIGNGSLTGPMPLFPVAAGVRVMPSAGYALAPYGGEWTIRAAIRHEVRTQRQERRITSVTLRVGDTGASTTWGVGMRAADVVRLLGFPVGIAVDIWRQPDLLADYTSDPQQTGAGALGTIVVPLPRMFRTPWSEGIQITAGYKARGFVPGEQLGGGGVLRAGITMSPR